MSLTEELRFPGDAVELAARRWKQGDVPVLALHGWLDNAGTFDRLAPLLPGLDIVALDFPGHGLSGHRPRGNPYHFVDWVAEVFCAADHLGWGQFGLLAHSMGAGVACLVAGTFPERVTNLVLIEGLGPFSQPDDESPEQLKKALLYQASPKARVYATREEALKRLLARGLKPESAECLASRALTKSEQGWNFTYAPEVRAPSRARLSEAQVRAFLRRIACPTLLIAAKDGLPMPESFEGRMEAVAGLRRLGFEKGGHHLHLDYPEMLASQVRKHLS